MTSACGLQGRCSTRERIELAASIYGKVRSPGSLDSSLGSFNRCAVSRFLGGSPRYAVGRCF